MDIELMKAQRKRLKLSQQAVADAVGRHRTAIVSWEAGRYKPDLEVLPRLAEVLKLSTDALLGVATTPAEVGEGDGRT